MAAIKQIDSILLVLNSGLCFTVERIIKELETKREGIAFDYIFPIMDKLVKDGYATSEIEYFENGDPKININGRTMCKYQITFDGEMFIEMGGYLAQKDELTQSKIRIEILEKNQNYFNAQMVFLNAALVIVGIISTLNPLLDFLNKFINIYPEK